MVKSIFILLVLTLSATFIFAQENNHHQRGRISKKTNSSTNFIDTLYTVPNPSALTSSFGFYGQDIMTMWFKAPADLYLKEVGFDFQSINQPPPQLATKVVACVLPIDSLQYLNNEYWGYYLTSDSFAVPFCDTSGCEWISFNGHSEPFGSFIWSDGGVGQPFIPIGDTLNPATYQFIDLSALGYPDIHQGTIFGVVLKNLDPNLGGGQRVALWSTPVGNGGQNENSLFKYYADGNPPGSDFGWWTRDVTLAFAAVVDIYGSMENDDAENEPNEFSLEQNYPNPFNPSTKIKYSVNSTQNVSLKVYDVLGNEIATLVNEEREPGAYEVEFNRSDLSSGIYFYQLKAGKFLETKKMILLK